MYQFQFVSFPQKWQNKKKQKTKQNKIKDSLKHKFSGGVTNRRTHKNK